MSFKKKNHLIPTGSKPPLNEMKYRYVFWRGKNVIIWLKAQKFDMYDMSHTTWDFTKCIQTVPPWLVYITRSKEQLLWAYWLLTRLSALQIKILCIGIYIYICICINIYRKEKLLNPSPCTFIETTIWTFPTLVWRNCLMGRLCKCAPK